MERSESLDYDGEVVGEKVSTVKTGCRGVKILILMAWWRERGY